MSEDGRRIVMAIREDMKKLKLEFLEQLHLKSIQMEELTHTLEALKDRVSKLEERVEDSEAYERKDTLIISGANIPSVAPGKNCVLLV